MASTDLEKDKFSQLLDSASYNKIEKEAILAVLPYADTDAKKELLEDIETTKRDFLEFKKKRMVAEIEFLEKFLHNNKVLEKQNQKEMVGAIKTQKNSESSQQIEAIKRKLNEI